MVARGWWAVGVVAAAAAGIAALATLPGSRTACWTALPGFKRSVLIAGVFGGGVGSGFEKALFRAAAEFLHELL